MNRYRQRMSSIILWYINALRTIPDFAHEQRMSIINLVVSWYSCIDNINKRL